MSGSEELEIAKHTENVARHKEEIARAARQLMRFLVELALAAILALLVVLPHALRALAILAWVAGMGATLAAAWTLYSAISPNRIGNALVSVMFAGIVAALPTLFELGDQMLGGYAFSALCGFGLAALANGLIGHTELYPIIAVVPNAFAVVGIIAYATHRTKKLRSQEEDKK